MKRALLVLALWACQANAETVTRAVAGVNGVNSPRGFFNISVNLYRLPAVEWVKFDLEKNLLTLDCAPGSRITEAELRDAIRSAMTLGGYKPGAVKVLTVEAPTVHDSKLGWRKIKRPTSRSALGRWFQINF
jgi:hypothetical protein